MISTKQFNALHKEINASRCGKLYGKAHVATISGPSIVIEIIVKVASVECGIPMDWNYVGGRGIIWTKNQKNIKNCRRSLALNVPQSDLTTSDLI